MSKTIQEIILEQIANKKLFNAMFNKWKEEKRDLTSDEVEKIFNRFAEIKNGLGLKRPQVITFLHYFDGSPGQYFDPKNLKDITKYSYKQIKFLISEYVLGDEEDMEDEEQGNEPKDFGRIGSSLDEENIQASKEKWYSSEGAIINEDGFRVYPIYDQKTAIKYGYYLDKFNAEHNEDYNSSYYTTPPVWCVTRRNPSNMWSNYRDDRTFYFVIDENRSDRYHLGALQRDTSISSGYRITSRYNDGDNMMSWEKVLEIYPKLAKHQELIAPKSFDRINEFNKEDVTRDPVALIDESNTQYGFKKQPKSLKKKYIQRGKSLTKAESWESMDNELRLIYINMTERNDFMIRFPNFEFLNAVRKNNNEFSSLNRRLEVIGLNGTIDIFNKLLEVEFKPHKGNLVNSNIKIYKSKRDGKCGIYNGTIGQWYKRGGIAYLPTYSESKPKMMQNLPTNERFMLITYTINNTEDNKSFYCLIPIMKTKVKGYFYSAEAFERLKETIQDVEGKSFQKFSADTETDTDIQEKGDL